MSGVDQALALAAKGYRVHPLEGKKPTIPDWPARATTDEATIRRWWRRWPDAAVGIATGHGLLVVDLDVKGEDNGITSWAPFADDAPTVTTRSGGQHVYYRTAEKFGNRAGVLPGVDIRGKGGQVVAYGDLPPLDELPELPERVAALLQGEPGVQASERVVGPGGVRAALTDELARIELAAEGRRNDTLNSAAFNIGQLVGPLLDEDEARSALLDAALTSGLGEDEAHATIDSGIEKGKKNPRRTTAEAAVVPIAEKYPRLDLAALLDPNRPEREWVVSGLISVGASVSLVAPAGTMKSLLMLALSVSVARGDQEFAGLTISRRRRVMYVDMENTDDDLADRMRSLGVRPDDLAELIYLHLPSLPPLDTPEGGQELLEIVEHYGLARGDLLVLDSFQRVVTGAENDADTYRAFYAATAAPLKKLGLTVLRTDNTGKDIERGARGSSSKRDDVDIELRMTRNDELLSLAPGKVRIGGVEPILLAYDVDDEGLLTFTTASDPFRTEVLHAREKLDSLGVPTDAGVRPAAAALKRAGHGATQKVIRQAVRDRKDRVEGVSREFDTPLHDDRAEGVSGAVDTPRRSKRADQ